MSDQLTSRQPHALRAARSVILRYDTNNDKQISEAEFAQIIQRVQSKLTLLPPQQRIAGKWAKPPADLIEPARTERILAAPFRLLRTHAADCQDAMSMTIITKTNGSGAVVRPIRGLLDPFEPLPAGTPRPTVTDRPLHPHTCAWHPLPSGDPSGALVISFVVDA